METPSYTQTLGRKLLLSRTTISYRSHEMTTVGGVVSFLVQIQVFEHFQQVCPNQSSSLLVQGLKQWQLCMLDMLEASLSHKQIVVWRGHIVPVCQAHMVSGEPGVKAHSSVSSCWIWDIKYETLIPMLRFEMYECVAEWFPWPDGFHLRRRHRYLR